jgi:hypothetical protein
VGALVAGAAVPVLGFVLRVPDSGVGAITLMSGSTVWADALDGIIDSPMATAGATTDARRPQWQKSLFLISSPPTPFGTSPGFLMAKLEDSRFPITGRSSRSESGKFQILAGTFGNRFSQVRGELGRVPSSPNR